MEQSTSSRSPFRLTLLKQFLAASLLVASASAFAAGYFVVVPVPNRAATSGNILVSLNGYALPAGQAGQAYAGFDFNSVLQVKGDPNFDASQVRWSVASGALPSGMSVSSSGKLTGVPSAGTTASFQVLAAYKTKAGQQSYQLFIAKLPGNGTLSVTALSFDGQAVNTQAVPKAVSLTNTGGDTLGVTGITSTGPFTVANTCPPSLAPNESCTSTVTFAPTSVGPLTGSLKVSTSTGDKTVDFSGTGLGTLLGTAPSPVSFGNVNTNASATQTFTLTNTGNIPTTALTYSAPPGLTETNTCGQALAAGASCTVTLTYAPRTATALADNITVASQDSRAQVALTGTPTCPGGTVTVTQTSDQTLQAPAACGHASIAMWGAGGGGYSGPGGGGGYAGATVPVPVSATLRVQTGQGGTSSGTCEYGSSQCTTSSTTYQGGTGGGGSFVYINGTLAMAAGGGGGAGGSGGGTAICPMYSVSPAGGVGGAGGAGGGTAGVAGIGASSTAPTNSGGGSGGNQSAGGAGGTMTGGGVVGQTGSSLHGGPAPNMSGYNYGGGGISGYGFSGNGASGAGGGGYYGGGSGGTGGGCSGGAGGGGGSGYIEAGATGAALLGGSGTTPGNAGSSLRGSAGTGGINGAGLNGLVSVTWQQ
jgi:hypothetical protein